jgi:glutamine synthetase
MGSRVVWIPAHRVLKLSPGEASELGLVTLPSTLAEAVEQLRSDTVLRSALGPTPDGDYIDYFADVKRAEFQAYHAQISPWEIDRYLSLV